MDKFQLYIHNKGSGPYKIPFKLSATYDEKVRVDGVLKKGKKAVIPSDISHCIDMDRLEADSKRGIVKYRTKIIKAGGK